MKRSIDALNPGLPFEDRFRPASGDGREVDGSVLVFWQKSLRMLPGSLAVIALAFLAYLPSVPGAFIMDDQRLVLIDNPLANGQLTPLSIWFQTDFPLTNLVFRWEWLAWGLNPAPYHLINIALHALSAILVWRILARLNIPGGWLAGVLFAIHPVCVNSVARIAELKNTLSLPFFLASILGYLAYESLVLYRTDSSERKMRRLGTVCYTLSVVCFVLALFSKTSTVMLPVFLLACAAWQRKRFFVRGLIHTTPHFFLAASFGLMSIWFQKYQALAGETVLTTSLWERIATAGRVFWFYLAKALLPLNLALVYPRWTMNAHSVSFYLPLILVCFGVVVCWRFRRSWGRPVFFGLGSFAILLFPSLGFFNAQFLTRWQVSDHLQYLPLIAPVALMCAVLSSISKYRINWFGAAAISLALLGLTTHRSRIFSNQETLMRDAIAKNPAASDAHNDLGVVLVKRNDLPAAIDEFAAAVQCDPGNATARSNLGLLLAHEGKMPEAKTQYFLALKTKPFDPETHGRLAELLRKERRLPEARAHWRIAVRQRPTVDGRLQFAGLLYETGEFREAATQFREVLHEQPESAEALNNLAWLLATCGEAAVRDGGEAVAYAERACQLTGFKQAAFMSTLAAAYAEAGRFSDAIDAAEKAIQLQTQANDPRSIMLNQQFLEHYRAGLPIRIASAQ